MKYLSGCFAGWMWLLAGIAALPAAAAEAPNIVYILCDDLGYGDVQALNPARGKIATPRLDRLAGEGLAFTDAHSGSSVCTPTRYGIMTGRYAWRSRLKNGVLGGTSPRLIEPGRLTVPALLKQHGYATACIGKWHLGLALPQPLTDPAGRIGDGPTALGFDRFFGISASLDMAPFAFIDNDRFTEPPTATKKWLREGPAAPSFEAVDVLPTLTRQAMDYIAAAAKAGKPFFLYLPLASPHTPIVPTPEWQGKSGISPYADFVMQTDHAVGQVLDALDAAGAAGNTLVFFTSDNGCSPAAHVEELEAKGHFASADRRGYKADIWDGGHHIPFLARWPGRIKPGTRSDQLICLTDLMATCAELVGAKLPDNAGEDSVSILPALLGKDKGPLREAVVHHSISGRFAVRQGPWKLELCPGSGGWAQPKDEAALKQGLPPIQLYDMADAAETNNVQAAHPDVVARLTALLDRYVADGRSTPGAPQANTEPVQLDKPKGKKAKQKESTP